MSDETPRLGLPLILAGQAQKEITHSEALMRLDAAVQAVVLARDLAAPPAEPAPGQAWIVAAGATGAWTGHDGAIAAWTAGGWLFLAPATGWSVWCLAEASLLRHDGGGWVTSLSPFGLSLAAASDAAAARAALGIVEPPLAVLGRQHGGAAKNDADTSETALFTLPIAGLTLGPDDMLRITAVWSYPSSAAVKSLRIRVGGTLIFSNSTTTTASLSAQAQIANRGSRDSQIGKAIGSSAFGTSGSAPLVAAIDFAQAQDVTITAQWVSAGSGDNVITLESALVELLRG